MPYINGGCQKMAKFCPRSPGHHMYLTTIPVVVGVLGKSRLLKLKPVHFIMEINIYKSLKTSH